MSELAVRWSFTSREAGISEPPFSFGNLAAHVGDDPIAVAHNRGLVAHALGVGRLVTMRPNHSNAVAVVGSQDTEIVDVDAIITSEAGLGLLAQGADCAPIVLADEDRGVIAAVHCGWRGVVAGIVPATLSAMAELGARPQWARIGPTICPSCYPVGDEVADAFSAAGGIVSVASNGQASVDVRGSVAAQFAQASVAVHHHGGCTFEDPRVYSYRRDGVTGRHGAAIALVEERQVEA